MNLLKRRVQMPRVIFEDAHRSMNEKILLSLVYTFGEEQKHVFAWRDICHTLAISKASAEGLVDGLVGNRALTLTEIGGKRIRLQVGDLHQTAIALEQRAERISLKMCFIQCLCGRDLRMDYLEQIRICPDCRRLTYYTPDDKLCLARGVH